MIRDLLLRFLVSPCQINLAWLPIVLCICGFTFVQVKNYPGYLSPDPFHQYNHIEEGVFPDTHPSVMTYTWKWLRGGYQTITGKTTVGNGMMYTLYNLLLWFGMFCVLRSAQSFWNRSNQLPIFFLFLILCILVVYILELRSASILLSKDIGLLGSYLAATGLLLMLPNIKKGKWLIAFAVLFFIFHGTALRHNALFAAFPLLCWLVWAIVPMKNLWVTFVTGIILWMAMLSGIHYVNYSLFKAVNLYPIVEIFFLDIWHLNARTPHYVLPPNTFANDFTNLDEKTFRDNFDPTSLYITRAFVKLNGNEIQEKYRFGQGSLVLSNTPDQSKLLERIQQRMQICNVNYGGFYRPNVRVSLPEVQSKYANDYQLLKAAWINRILMDPITYLKFKTQFFSQLCGLDLPMFKISAKKMFLVMFFMFVSLFISQNITSRAVFPWLMLTLSALFLILPLWLFCPDTEQIRYLYWFFAASFISIAYFLAHSPLFAAIMQTIQQYLEEKVLSKRR